MLLKGSPFSIEPPASSEQHAHLSLSLYAKSFCFAARHPSAANSEAAKHQLPVSAAVAVIHPRDPVMTLAKGEAADLAELLAVPLACQLRISIAWSAQPWSVTGLDQLEPQLQQRFAALCDDNVDEDTEGATSFTMQPYALCTCRAKMCLIGSLHN